MTIAHAHSKDEAGLPKNRQAYLSRSRPKGHPNPNLLRALAHGVREHPVQTQGREQHRYTRERSHQGERESLATSPATDHLGHRRRPMDDQRRIHQGDLRGHVRENALRRKLGGHDLRERPVPIGRELAMRVIERTSKDVACSRRNDKCAPVR